MTCTVCPPGHAHAANATCYVQHKCRCVDCKRGRAEYQFWWSHMRDAGKEILVDPTGTRRRLQALAALGWSARMIGERYGFAPSTVRLWGNSPRVQRATRDRVRRIYDELSMTLPPRRDRFEAHNVSLTVNNARRSGFLPPLAWDDDTIDDPDAEPYADAVQEPRTGRVDDAVVQLAIDGGKPRLSRAERRVVVTALNGRAWSAPRIAAWIGCNAKTVTRIRAELGLPVPDQMTIKDAA